MHRRTTCSTLVAVLIGFIFLPYSLCCLAEDLDPLQVRVVEVISNAASGRKSFIRQSISPSDLADYRLSERGGRTTFGKTLRPESDPPGTTYRITISVNTLDALPRNVWRLSSDSGDGETSVRRAFRTTRFGPTSYQEILLQLRKSDFLFEVLAFGSSNEQAFDVGAKALAQLLASADKLRLFNPQAMPSGPTLTGVWRGPMTNSKGSSTSSSALILRELVDGKVEGTWFAGWKLENVKRADRLLSWEHHRVHKGCRDYQVSMKLSSDYTKGNLRYSATDRCTNPHTYTGQATLVRGK